MLSGMEHEFYDFPYIGNNNPNWLIFFRGVETTNQLKVKLRIWYYHGKYMLIVDNGCFV